MWLPKSHKDYRLGLTRDRPKDIQFYLIPYTQSIESQDYIEATYENILVSNVYRMFDLSGLKELKINTEYGGIIKDHLKELSTKPFLFVFPVLLTAPILLFLNKVSFILFNNHELLYPLNLFLAIGISIYIGKKFIDRLVFKWLIRMIFPGYVYGKLRGVEIGNRIKKKTVEHENVKACHVSLVGYKHGIVIKEIEPLSTAQVKIEVVMKDHAPQFLIDCIKSRSKVPDQIIRKLRGEDLELPAEPGPMASRPLSLKPNDED